MCLTPVGELGKGRSAWRGDDGDGEEGYGATASGGMGRSTGRLKGVRERLWWWLGGEGEAGVPEFEQGPEAAMATEE